ncbi:MAG: hypothetical protein II063_03445, partial [Prevotella sp.]|nr:hypothetical protein [Prevotella sp.]
DNVIEPGRFKLEGQMTWGPRELHPYVQDEDILEAQYMRQGGDDTKWRVSKAGTYRIVVDLFYETIHAELVRKANTLSPTNIETVTPEKEQQVEYYDMNGMKMQQLRRGINIVRSSDGTIHKVMVK